VLYAVEGKPFGRLVLEMLSAALIVMLTALMVVCGVGDVESVTWSEMAVEAVLVGVPEMIPLEDRKSPAGRAPAARDQM